MGVMNNSDLRTVSALTHLFPKESDLEEDHA